MTPEDRTPEQDLADDVAPYRIIERIGSGGMGEVFLADDPRLGRRVAIKRLRVDRIPGPQVRRRLRREARYTAGLSHPGVVQVFDVLERDSADYVVMEWIQGEDLRKLIQRDGRLPVARVVELGRHLAGGLAEAHGRGIVHRDLKAENVLIDHRGHAKITDFGIAKRLIGDGMAGGESAEPHDAEESLTQADSILGTYRIMSPEQILGEDVGPRSDLFSFGILLYEALTAESPFEDKSPLATAHRIIDSEPAPITDLNPSIPTPLAQLIHGLLAKDPHLRPRSAREVELALADLSPRDLARNGSPRQTGMLDAETLEAERPSAETPSAEAPSNETLNAKTLHTQSTDARGPLSTRRTRLIVTLAVAVVAILAIWMVSQRRSLPTSGGEPQIETEAVAKPPIYVAAMAPELRVEGAKVVHAGEPETLAEAVRVAMVRGLIGLDGVSAKATAEIDRTSGDSVHIARSVAAEELISAALLYRGELARLTLSRLRVADGVLLWNDSVDLPTDDLLLVMRSVTGLIRRAYPTHSVRVDFPGFDINADGVERFLELRRRFLDRADPTNASILSGLEALRQDSPNFVDAHLLLAEVALHRFYDSRDHAHLELAVNAVEQARQLAPEDPRVLRQSVIAKLRANDLAGAEKALDDLALVLPGDVQHEDLRAHILRAKGRPGEAMALMRRVAEINPSLFRLVNLARLEIDQGEIAAARRHLRDAMERSPDDFEASSLLAQLELTVGDPAVAVGLYEQLLERSAGTSEMSNLGLAHMLLGDYDAAVNHFQRAFDTEPRNPFFALNLADAQWLAGERDRATSLYRGVIERISADPAAESAQFLTVQAQALAHLGRNLEAVALLQRASAKAPDSASVAYEAALVYALVGEKTSALVHAEMALDLGIEPRWFEFPWFDDLAQQPEFRTLLEGSRTGL